MARAPVIYHGTPLTPRAALQSMAGRAFCVSFWRPDDAEVVEAISPDIMFRQRRVFGMEGCAQARGSMVHSRRLDALFRVAGTPPVSSGTMGRDTGCTGRAVPAQRQPSFDLAVRDQRRAALAYGCANRSPLAPVRQIPARLPRLDRDGGWRESRCGVRGVVSPDGRDSAAPRQSPAVAAPYARGPDRAGIRLYRDGGRHQPSAERPSL